MSKEVSFKRTRLGDIVCAVLMLAVLVLQFTPYWHIGEGEEQQNVSIGAYVWFPTDHKEVDTYMKEPVQAVKRFALEKIALLGAEGSNHA